MCVCVCACVCLVNGAYPRQKERDVRRVRREELLAQFGREARVACRHRENSNRNRHLKVESRPDVGKPRFCLQRPGRMRASHDAIYGKSRQDVVCIAVADLACDPLNHEWQSVVRQRSKSRAGRGDEVPRRKPPAPNRQCIHAAPPARARRV